MSQMPIEHYLEQTYPFHAIADEDGGWTIVFPDLPGCLTVAETWDEIGPMADEARRLWIETAAELGQDIPEPTYPETFSGKFNVRLPRSLHRRLAESAEAEHVSLNQLVVALLERGLAGEGAETSQSLDALTRRIDALVTRIDRLDVAPLKSQRSKISA